MLKKNEALCQDLKLKVSASEELDVWGTHQAGCTGHCYPTGTAQHFHQELLPPPPSV